MDDAPTTSSLPALVDELLRHKQSLEGQLAALCRDYQAKTKPLETELERVCAGLTALEGKTRSSASKPASQRTRTTPAKPGYSDTEIEAVLAEILAGADHLSEKDLREKVYLRAKQAGKSLQGLHKKVTRALRQETLASGEGK